ncbi:hypothetical protein NEFER03_1606 [Nematocida sp. LUAm3]|nr:hypothetical protein NEFER03_1606 [Nematocida sp. LUAm3]
MNMNRRKGDKKVLGNIRICIILICLLEIVRGGGSTLRRMDDETIMELLGIQNKSNIGKEEIDNFLLAIKKGDLECQKNLMQEEILNESEQMIMYPHPLYMNRATYLETEGRKIRIKLENSSSNLPQDIYSDRSIIQCQDYAKKQQIHTLEVLSDEEIIKKHFLNIKVERRWMCTEFSGLIIAFNEIIPKGEYIIRIGGDIYMKKTNMRYKIAIKPYVRLYSDGITRINIWIKCYYTHNLDLTDYIHFKVIDISDIRMLLYTKDKYNSMREKSNSNKENDSLRHLISLMHEFIKNNVLPEDEKSLSLDNENSKESSSTNDNALPEEEKSLSLGNENSKKTSSIDDNVLPEDEKALSLDNENSKESSSTNDNVLLEKEKALSLHNENSKESSSTDESDSSPDNYYTDEESYFHQNDIPNIQAPIGNLGTTCYISTALQILYRIKEFRNMVERIDMFSGDLNIPMNVDANTEIVKKIAALFRALKRMNDYKGEQTKHIATNPTPTDNLYHYDNSFEGCYFFGKSYKNAIMAENMFKRALLSLLSQLKYNPRDQGDPVEFIRLIITSIETYLKSSNNKHVELSMLYSLFFNRIEWTKYDDEGKSPLSKDKNAEHYKNMEVTYEIPLFATNVNIEDSVKTDYTIDLGELWMNNFTFYVICHPESEKIIETKNIIEQPQYLFIQMPSIYKENTERKFFYSSHMPEAISFNGHKSSTECDCFTLFGIIEYLKLPRIIGHYCAYVKNEKEQWVRYNDHLFSQVSDIQSIFRKVKDHGSSGQCSSTNNTTMAFTCYAYKLTKSNK